MSVYDDLEEAANTRANFPHQRQQFEHRLGHLPRWKRELRAYEARKELSRIMDREAVEREKNEFFRLNDCRRRSASHD